MNVSFVHVARALAAGLFVFVVACSGPSEGKESAQAASTEPAAKPALNDAELIERGRYLVNVGGCNDCHSPKKMTEMGPVPDPALLLSGHPAQLPMPPATENPGYMMMHLNGTAAVGPWGTSFAGNLTPHETGIGLWTEEQFIRALQHGDFKGMEGTRKLLPPMPWQNYAEMTREDVIAIFRYLKSIPPVNNIVPAPVPPAGA